MSLFSGSQFTPDNISELQGLEKAEFEDCEFQGIEIIESSMREWRFVDCRFVECSLSAVSLAHATMRECEFSGCRLTGLRWCDLENLVNPRFEDCRLDLGVFGGLNLKSVQFLRCSIVDADFYETNLFEANFDGSDLKDSIFIGADLRGAKLDEATNYSLDPTMTKLKGARVSSAEAFSILENMGVIVSR